MNKITLLKSVDKVVGKFLVSLLDKKARPERTPRDINSILIIRPGGIGDAVLLLPAIRALKSRFPEASIDVLCEKRNAGIFGLTEDIDHVYLYDKGSEIFRCLRNKYDVVIDTEQWHRLSAVIAYLAGARARIGFDTNERRKLFTHTVSYSHDDYEADSFLHLVSPLTGEVRTFQPDEPFIKISAHVPAGLLPASGRKLIAIFPGASVAERRWGGEKFGKLAKILCDKGYDIAVLGSSADRGDADEIRHLLPGCIDLAGKTSLKEVAAVLKNCRLLISADSGILHIAYGVGTSTVSLFGSGIEKKWAPRGRNHIVLNKRLPCSPCTRFGYTPRCRNDFECITSVNPAEVAKAVETILAPPSR